MHHSTPSLPRQFLDNGTRFLNLRAFGASPRPPSILQTIEEPLWSLQTAYLAHQGSNLFFAYVLTCLQFIFYGPSPPRHTPRALAAGNGVQADVRHQGRQQGRRWRTLRHLGRFFSCNQPFPSRNERHGSKPCGGHHFLSILWFGFAFWRSQGLALCGSRCLITFFFSPRSCTIDR